MALGLLLARAGVDVVVLEKHSDFLRDFRGDTIHPSTLELMHELGILEEFLQLPHQRLSLVGGQIDDKNVTVADFSRLPTHCKFIALMPQWDFLDFIAEKAKRSPHFRLHMESEVLELLEENGRVAGVRAKTPDGVMEVRADLIVAADGRRSIVRKTAGFDVMDLGAPIDLLWMRLSRRASDPTQTLWWYRAGRILITIDRGDYWQCAYEIPKGAFTGILERGLPALRDEIGSVVPFLRDRTAELNDWNDIKLLAVTVERLRQWWSKGLLCIGDSAHTMSPIGGIGINLAIQDAVAAANILAQPLLERSVGIKHLREVQRRRELPTQITQSIQVLAHKHFIGPPAGGRASQRERQRPWVLTLLLRFPQLRYVPTRLLGLGLRPEHVRTGNGDFAGKPVESVSDAGPRWAGMEGS